MAKISEIFSLDKNQYELDFVNIDPDKDCPVYLNPFVFSTRGDTFSVDATRTIKSFFQHNLELIDVNQTNEARKNFNNLGEPNETCLGMSRGNPKGKGMGGENTTDIFESILNSDAIKSGLVDDLEDTSIFIDGIGKDKVSDMTTNIIRGNLIKYTQDQCRLHGIPLTSGAASGLYWDISKKKWVQHHTKMLIISGRRILLVPKGVVSYVKEFNYDKYHQHYALEFLQDDHLERNTHLVQRTYDKEGRIKRTFVTKKSVEEEELPKNKNILTDFTARHPHVFKKFKEEISKETKPIKNSDLDDVSEASVVDYLVSELEKVPTGGKDASKYHRLMIGILELVFYPHLINPVKEKEINEGRKRIDICFDNAGSDHGFFYRLQHVFQIPCQYIFFECKNYSTDIVNPEIDQMIGRLSPNRGKFGIILCRKVDDMNLLINRCRDAYLANQGLIIPLTDEDIKTILEKHKKREDGIDAVLSDRARQIML